MHKNIISTKSAPGAIGPYSQGVSVGDFIFTSGQLPINPKTGDLISDDITAATKQALENVKAVLEEGGTTLENVVKTTVYLKNLDDFSKMNEVYAEYFVQSHPARSAFQVAKLPLDAIVEIEVIAIK